MLRWNSLILGALTVITLPLAAGAETKKATVKVTNNSDWSIDNFFLSPVNVTEWGQDQLGEKIIGKGETFTLTDIPCDKFDVKLVDGDGDECVVEDVDICGKSNEWIITSAELVKCQEETKKEE